MKPLLKMVLKISLSILIVLVLTFFIGKRLFLKSVEVLNLDIFQDRDGKLDMVYAGSGEQALGIAALNIKN